MPNTVIAWVNAPSQGKHNDIDFLDRKNRPVGELYITGVDDGENESPQIELIEPETDLDPISAYTETLPEIVERQYIPTI